MSGLRKTPEERMAMAKNAPAIAAAKKDLLKERRVCQHCHEEMRLGDFLANNGWAVQRNRDVWCKNCASKCVTMEDVKEYFWENNKQFRQEDWNTYKNQAMDELKYNSVFVQSGDARKDSMLNRYAAKKMISNSYKAPFAENDKDGYMPYADAKKRGLFDDADADKKEYNEFFNGSFTKRELKYLQDYYNELDEAFTFDNESIRDYAKKCARASLRADRAQDDYAMGKCSFQEVKDAIALFDMLSKSANFAACKRKTPETTGLTSWSEAAYKLETTGHPMQRKIEWTQDDVDKCIKHFQHTMAAMTAEGG